MSVATKITRRDFLRQTGVGTGALVFGCYISPKGLFAEDIFHQSVALNSFVRIEPLHGTIIIMANRSEMGQGIRSSLAAVLADELEADWSRVEVRQADAEADKYVVPNPVAGAHPTFLISDEGSQFADSSRSMAAYYLPMRLFGAGIRVVLVGAAARVFGIEPAQCEARQHKVWRKDGKGIVRSLDYGDPLLLLAAKKVAAPTPDEARAALKPSKQWNFIGKEMPFVDVRDMVTGKAGYGADADPGRPGMLTAMIVRCPVANGTVKSFDDKAARAVPGVKDVRKVLPDGFPIVGGVGGAFIPHAGVAVVAENTWAALQGRRALKVEWDLTQSPAAIANAKYESKAYRKELEASTASAGNKLRSRGDVDAAFALPHQAVEASYYVPHLAQAPMEPPVAVALYENGRWEIWCPTQGPDVAQHYVGLAMLYPKDPVAWLVWQVSELTEVKPWEQAAQQSFNEQLGKMLGLDQTALFKRRDELKQEVRDKVKVHVTLLGGGFGRKSKPDYAVEAAFLATQQPGVPIRVQWTREDDIQFSYYNAVNHQYLKAAIDAGGKATALLQRSAFTSFFATLFPPADPRLPAAANETFKLARAAFHCGGEYPFGSGIELGQGLEDMPFDLENLRLENCAAPSHIRVGWMRSVANIYHAFSICSFADELAIAAGRDCKDYLLELIGKGRILDLATLKAEGLENFDNNQFPVDPLMAQLSSGKSVQVLPGYPPDTGRLRAVVERVAQAAGWDEKVKQYKQQPKGRGLGIAAHRSFLAYVAMVIDASLADNVLTIHEIHAAIDCGIAVNPDRVRAQMEGGIIYGLSLALQGEITVRDGAVEQHNFDDYPVLRLHQTPKSINIHIVEPKGDLNEAVPVGVGEPPVPPVAPALANAIVAAGGPRLRKLPFWPEIQIL
ncbi:MAG TPA: molybdopterin cofactor-binding domain-containing protein [Thermoanaerobaculia bacterium]|nr:molybdopterin cofactor-binding domain-containing protein [Thermoanaerobaculia bacterium]